MSTPLHVVAHGELHVEGEATVIQANPAFVTEENCSPRHGISTKALRKMCRDGLPSVSTPDGRMVALVDLIAWLRARGDVMPREPVRPKPTTDEDRRRAALAQGGVKLRSVKAGAA